MLKEKEKPENLLLLSTTRGFTKAELQPQSGFPQPRNIDPQQTEQLKKFSKEMAEIFIDNPFHLPVLQALDFLMATGVSGVVQLATRNASNSYAGKSSCGKQFKKIVDKRGTYPAGSKPVIHVELEQACTGKRFWQAINGAYGDGFADKKDVTEGRITAYTNFLKFGTRLVIIDEAQHALYRSKGQPQASDYIKRFISDNVVAVALFGTERTKELHVNSIELADRFGECCDIIPVSSTDPKQLASFMKFFAKFDQALLDLGMFTKLAGLDSARIWPCLFVMSRGYIGRAVKLVKLAALRAFRRGADCVEVCDLSHCMETWAMDANVYHENTFKRRDGL